MSNWHTRVKKVYILRLLYSQMEFLMIMENVQKKNTPNLLNKYILHKSPPKPFTIYQLFTIV